jgi:hypothetical protein
MAFRSKHFLFLFVFACLWAPSVQAQRGKGHILPHFDLKTQNEEMIYYNRHFSKKVTLVVLANYCSIESAGVWSIPIYYHFHNNPQFRFAFIFSKTCLPGFIPNAFVSSSIQNAVESLKLPYILMDWDNVVSQRLGAHEKYAQIYLIDQQGVIRWQQLLKNPMNSTFSIEKTIKELL